MMIGRLLGRPPWHVIIPTVDDPHVLATSIGDHSSFRRILEYYRLVRCRIAGQAASEDSIFLKSDRTNSVSFWMVSDASGTLLSRVAARMLWPHL
jgi:hypothetical protein